MGDQFSEAQLNKVKELLTNLVKNELIDENKLDVKNIVTMLGNFPTANMEQALALSTKTAYDNTLELLARNTVKETGNSDSVNAANAAYNNEIKEAVEAFLKIMKGDNWNDVDGSSSAQRGQYGVNRQGTSLNAFEAVIAMTFGGVANTPISITNNGHTPVGNEVRATERTNWAAGIDNSSVLATAASGTALPIESHEARAGYIYGLWMKYDMAPQLFGAGHHQIVVRQVTNVVANACCCQAYCAKVGITERVRTYDLWDNSTAGKNHLLSTIGTIIATTVTTNGQTQGKLLGGEEAFSKDILNRALTVGDEFTMTQMGAALRTSAQVSLSMSVEKLNNAWDMGYNKLSHLGITTTGTHNSIATEFTDATVVSTNVFGKFSRNQNGVASPQIANVMASKFRDLFLKSVLANDENTDVDAKCLATAIDIAQQRVGQKAFKVDNTVLGQETGTSISQAMPVALGLINEVRALVGQQAFDDYYSPDGLSYLADHDNTGRAMNTAMLTQLAETTIYASVPGNSDKTTTETLFEHEVYTKHKTRYDVNSNGTLEGQLTSSNLIVNKYFTTNQKDTTQKIVANIIKRNFILSPSTFIGSVLPESLAHMAMPSSGLSAVTGQTQANMYQAFSATAGTDTAWGQLYANNSIDNFRSNNTGFVHENALVYFFMLSLLTRTEFDAALETEATRQHNGLQLASLLKYTEATTNPVADSKVELKHGDSTYKIRNGNFANSWAGTDLTQGNLWNTSGNLDDMELTAVNHADTNGNKSSTESSTKYALVSQLSAALFSTLNDRTNQSCRLELINGYQIKASKIQGIAGEGVSTISDYTGADALNVKDGANLNTLIDTTHKGKINNGVFVKAAIMSLAKAQGYYNKATEAAAKTGRDSGFITDLNDALEGSTPVQQKEFFFIAVELAGVTLVSPNNGNDEKSYKNLAESILVQLAEELQDEEGSTAYHMVEGWKVSHSLLSAKENRSPLIAAFARTYRTGVINGASMNEINNLTAEAEKVNTDYDKQQKALASDKKILRLAQIALGIVDKGSVIGIYDFRKEVSPLALGGAAAGEAGSGSDVANKKKVTMMYMAAFTYESSSEEFRLYDSESVCAGLQQEAVTALITDASLTESDLRTLKHGVEVEEEGTSKTNHKTHAESHTFVAIDHGHVAVCTGFGPNGEPAYADLKMDGKPTI